MDPQTKAFHWSLITLNSLSFIINSAVIVTFLKFRRKLLYCRQNNKLLFSLSTADWCVSINGTVTGFLLLTNQELMIYKLFGTLPLFGSMFVSIFSLGVMTTDRLIAVKYPLRYGSLMTSKRILRLIILSWIIPCVIIAIQVVILFKTSSNTELKVRSFLLAVFFLMASMVLSASNWYLLTAIRKQNEKFAAYPVPTSQLHSYNLSRNHADEMISSLTPNIITCPQAQNCATRPPTPKVSKKNKLRKPEPVTCTLCVWIVVVFLICWIPLTSYRFTSLIGRTTPIPWLRRLGLCLATSNSLFSPCLYYLKRRDFRKCFKELFGYKSSKTYSADQSIGSVG